MHVIGEHYHVYNRGAHKAPIFSEAYDYLRFSQLLYLANTTKPLINPFRQENIFESQRGEAIVNIFAYCLMPNHFHIGLVEMQERGIERFIRKLCTGYVMYYNKKYNHSGTLFQGKYKCKHVNTENYLNVLIEYIHLNPYGIEESDLMKEARPEYYNKALDCSKKYEFSSFKDYLGQNRPQGKIVEVRPTSSLARPL